MKNLSARFRKKTSDLIFMKLEEPIKFWSRSESWGRYTNYFSLSLTLQDWAFGPGVINVIYLHKSIS